MELEEYSNIFYFNYINNIGGIESWFYYIAKKYNDYDITIFYKSGDKKQIERLRKYVRVIKFNNQKIKCKKAFFCFNTEILNFIDAEEKILFLHGDYKDMIERGQLSINGLPNWQVMDKVVGVSKTACKSFEELTGCKVELCYNPIELDEPKRILKLISATRLTKEKGRNRMIQLGDELNKSGIPYIWLVFTNSQDKIKNPNIIYMDSRLDISNYIASADALVQLSDNEGYCYSVVESLMLGTPVIVTKCPVFEELGLTTENSIKLEFDMSNLDVNDIYDRIFNMNFEYQPQKDNILKLLDKTKSRYKEELEMKVKVKALPKFNGLADAETGVIRKTGDEWITSKPRADYLLDQEAIEILEIIEDEEPLETSDVKPKKLEKAVKKTNVSRKNKVLQK